MATGGGLVPRPVWTDERRAKSARNAAARVVEQALPEVAVTCPRTLEQARDYLAPFTPQILDAIRDGCLSGDRTSLRVATELFGWTGNRTMLVALVCSELGVSSTDEAKRLIERAKEVQDVDEESTAKMAEQFLRERAKRTGERLVIE